VVSVGYYADGIPGAVAGWLAMITPAALIILLLRSFGRSVDHPRVRSLQQAVVFASAGLLVAASLPLAHLSQARCMVLRKADLSSHLLCCYLRELSTSASASVLLA